MGKFRPVSSNYNPRQDSSPSADGYHADPTAETGSEEASGFYADETLILVQDDRNGGDFCLCGCEQPTVGKDSLFRMGHDARLRGKLIRAHLMGIEVARVHGGAIISGDALTYAKSLGESFSVALTDAWTKEADRIATSLEKANRKVLDRATAGPVGDKVLVKVGRWEYTGQVAAVYDDGDTLEVEYVTKQGEVKTIRKPKSEVQA